MIKKKPSEVIFGIPRQPDNTCPYIDDFVSSVRNIGEVDDDDELIEIDADYRSLELALDNVRGLKEWQEGWIDIGIELKDRLSDILSAINKYNDDEVLNEEDSAYSYLYAKDEIDLIDMKDELDEHIKSWQKNIKSSYQDIESIFSSAHSNAENNDSSVFKTTEIFRDEIKGFRDFGNEMKIMIRNYSEQFLPEKCDRQSLIDLYYEKYDEDEEKKEIIALIKEKESKTKNAEEHKNDETKSKKRSSMKNY